MSNSTNTLVNNHEKYQLVVDLDNVILESEDLIGSNQNKEVRLVHMLSLLTLLTRIRLGKEPLVDYSNSHVVTLDQYLVILKQKVVDKEIVDKLRE
jgi:hypothetical protein